MISCFILFFLLDIFASFRKNKLLPDSFFSRKGTKMPADCKCRMKWGVCQTFGGKSLGWGASQFISL